MSTTYNNNDAANHTPGPQMPQKYPQVGANYKRYGEQPGYIYNYITDHYDPDPKVVRQQAQQNGLIPPEAPKQSLGDQLLPIGAGALALGGGQALGKAIPGAIGKVGGLFGLGDSAPAAPQVVSIGGQSAAPMSAGLDNTGAFIGRGADSAASAPGGMFSLQGFGSGGNLIAPLAGAALGYDYLANGRRGATGVLEAGAAGAGIGSYFNAATGGLPVGTIAGAAIGAGIGLANNAFGGHKDKDQLSRDGIREGLLNAGAIDKNYQIKLADGSTFNMGKDGHAKLKNTDGSERHYYDVDFNNPLAAGAVPMANQIAERFTGGDEKLRSDFAGYLINAATSNAKTAEDVQRNLEALSSQIPADGNSTGVAGEAPVGQAKVAVQSGPSLLDVSKDESDKALETIKSAVPGQPKKKKDKESAGLTTLGGGQVGIAPGLLGLKSANLLDN